MKRASTIHQEVTIDQPAAFNPRPSPLIQFVHCDITAINRFIADKGPLMAWRCATTNGGYEL